MNRPTKLAAAITSGALSLLFISVYGGCNWVTAHRTDVGTWYYSWESFIPFVPVMIVPYMSIDLFFVAGPFLCRSHEELRTLALRIAFAILVAGLCFLLVPLKLAVPCPPVSGWQGAIFHFLHGFDQPYNLVPSLHITLRTILADLYARHTRGPLRFASHVWFSLIGFSTVLTYQHHIVDVIGGFMLAAVCFYLFRERIHQNESSRLDFPNQMAPGIARTLGAFLPLRVGGVCGADGERAGVRCASHHLRVQGKAAFRFAENKPRLPVIRNPRIGAYYLAGSLAFAAAAFACWPWTAVLLWPAMSLAIVSSAYWGLGPGVFRKENGRLPLSTRIVLGPCLIGQWLSLRSYRRQCNAWDPVAPGLWIGARLGEREAGEAQRLGVTAVLDLTAEFLENRTFRSLAYKNIPVLDLSEFSAAQLREAVDFISQHCGEGVVYVHCKIGYSRSAAVVGAFLLASGRAKTIEECFALMRQVRPTIVFRPEVRQALEKFIADASGAVSAHCR